MAVHLYGDGPVENAPQHRSAGKSCAIPFPHRLSARSPLGPHPPKKSLHRKTVFCPKKRRKSPRHGGKIILGGRISDGSARCESQKFKNKSKGRAFSNRPFCARNHPLHAERNMRPQRLHRRLLAMICTVMRIFSSNEAMSSSRANRPRS